MNLSPQQCLQQLQHRTLDVAAFEAHIQAAVRADPEHTEIWYAIVQQALSLALLPADSGQRLLQQLAVPVTAVEATLISARAAESTIDEQRTSVRSMQDLSLAATHYEVGMVIKDRFVLETQIGRGGMGVVFAAIDLRKQEAGDPNPYVAIKMLNADFAQHPDAFVALQREAHKAQSLAHPNVATVFDFDRAGNTAFMTMELLQGQPLEILVRTSRGRGVGRELALDIIRGVAEGLAYAHRKGIVHSDLKPGNIFITADKVPKILDFGIARALPSVQASTTVTDTFDAGQLGAYTEAYATIEMMEGADPHPADDVYALGLIAYELLVGAHPYRRFSCAQARAENIKAAAPKILRRREWQVLKRCIAVERAARPRDAAELLRQLTGVTRLQQGLMVATLLLLWVAGYFGYRSYQAAGPDIAFAQLPPAVQQQFRADMQAGDQLWQFFVNDQNVLALQEAVEQYAAAYQLHPRNRQAVRALEKVADAALTVTTQPQQRHAFAAMLAERSDYLAQYAPVRDALTAE